MVAMVVRDGPLVGECIEMQRLDLEMARVLGLELELALVVGLEPDGLNLQGRNGDRRLILRIMRGLLIEIRYIILMREHIIGRRRRKISGEGREGVRFFML